MSPDDDPLDDLVERLLRLREKFGEPLYRAAAQAALHGVACAVLREAERRAACLGRPPESGKVVRFPGARRPENQGSDES